MVHIDIGLILVWVWVWCSTLATIFLPLPLIRKILRERAVGPASIIPLLSLLANCHVWSMYGFLGKAWFPNFPAFVIGDVVSWCYVFIYWRYSENRRKVGLIIAGVAAALLVPTLYVTVGFLGFTGQTREEVWRTHGLCFCDFTVFAASVLTLKNRINVFKLKSTASIDVRALVVGTSYSGGWITYSYVYSNWIIGGPQVWIIMLHAAAWVMLAVFGRNSRQTASITGSADTQELSIALSVDDKKEDFTGCSEFQALQSPLNIIIT